MDRLRKRDIDLAILRLSLSIRTRTCRRRRCSTRQLCVIASQDHPLAERASLTWPDLLQQRWVMPPADCYFFEHVLRTLTKTRPAFAGARGFESFSINIQFGMVMHGSMLCFGMRSQVDFAPGKNRLVRLPFELPSIPRPVGASLSAREPNPLARQLVGHIRRLAAAP